MVTGYGKGWAKPFVPVVTPDGVVTAEEFWHSLKGQASYYRCLADIEYGESDGVIFINLLRVVSKHDFE